MINERGHVSEPKTRSGTAMYRYGRSGGAGALVFVWRHL